MQIVSVILESMEQWQFKMTKDLSSTSELQGSIPEGNDNV